MDLKFTAVDIYLRSLGIPSFENKPLSLKLEKIFNRGTQVYPGDGSCPQCTDIFQCQFRKEGSQELKHDEVLTLLKEIQNAGYHWVQIQNVYDF